MKAGISEVGSMAVAVEANKSFQLYEGGVYDGDCGTQINHAVVAVGYGEENGVPFWKIRNSWSA